MADEPERTYPHLHLRLTFANGGWIGPGKADLLEGIAETGSISGAGRRMGMSYKRAWGLAEALNTMFQTPLVTASRGGPAHGGAELTEAGRAVLAHYRGLQARASEAGAGDMDALAALARGSDMSGRK